MKHRTRAVPVVIVSLLALGPGARAEEDTIHACTDANGAIVYQTDPCPPTAPTKAVPPAAAPTRRATRETAPKSPPRPTRARQEPTRRAFGGGGDRFPTSLDEVAGSRHSGYDSPAETWSTFLSAVERGDRLGAADCFVPATRAGFGPDARGFPLARVIETLRSFTRIEVEGDLGPFWSIRALRPRMPPKWIFFERTPQGEWKLVAL